jgi:hypothetical protein
LSVLEVTLSLPTTVGSSAAHRRKRQRSLRGPTHHVRQVEVNFLAKEIGVRFQLFGQLKYHIRAARHGDHFLSERPEK